MSVLRLATVRELFVHVANFLPPTDICNFSTALNNTVVPPFPDPEYLCEKRLFQGWRDFFTNLDWAGVLLQSFKQKSIDVDIIIVGPDVQTPRVQNIHQSWNSLELNPLRLNALALKHRRNELLKAGIPHVVVYVVFRGGLHLTFEDLKRSRAEIRRLLGRNIWDNRWIKKRIIATTVVRLTVMTPLERFAPYDPEAKRISVADVSDSCSAQRKKLDITSMGYWRITNLGIQAGVAESPKCFRPIAGGLHFMVGADEMELVNYRLFKIPHSGYGRKEAMVQ